MKLGEVCLQTSDVVRLSNFYKELLGVENGSDDPVHQFILAGETTLTIYNDGAVRTQNSGHISLAFTAEDVDKEYEHLLRMGVTILEPPTTRPWGARNMSFYDPDGNTVSIRSILK